MNVVPAAWMQPCTMKRIVFHWSAGPNKATALDRQHYHLIVEGDGNLVKGNHDISDNVNTRDGDYAAHTRNCNTNVIGVSMAGMLNAKESPLDVGPQPITLVQWNKCGLVMADLCKFYKIPVTSTTVLSHAEVQGNLGIAQRGKWDVAILPFDRSFNTAKKCGDRMRAEVSAAMK